MTYNTSPQCIPEREAIRVPDSTKDETCVRWRATAAGKLLLSSCVLDNRLRSPHNPPIVVDVQTIDGG
jgi:hypothetical protein